MAKKRKSFQNVIDIRGNKSKNEEIEMIKKESFQSYHE